MIRDPFEIAAHLAAALDAAGVPYAIGGAIAYGLWGDPRGTSDVDVNLFVDHAGLAVEGDDLDRAYVRRWLVDMMGEDDIRVEAWDRLCSP